MGKQVWVKDAILSFIGSLLIWLVAQMRDDFKSLVVAVNHLTVKLEVLTEEVANDKSRLADHESRIRDVERKR